MEAVEEDDQSKAVMLFGRDLRKIPCFKHSMLTGIYGGIAVSLVTFLFTSRPKTATYMGIGSYMGIATVYFCHCRYNFIKQKYAFTDLQNILRQQTVGRDDQEYVEVVQEEREKLIDA